MYIVKAGDNLLSIARKEMDCHIKYAELVEVNKLESTVIYPGQVLRFTKSLSASLNFSFCVSSVVPEEI